ncbi:MAG: transporter substrate-binding domain-containing protein [Clostridia bacterium]|nr:transporter substrate-binding domain-containing protein [Clostridia bacterium]
MKKILAVAAAVTMSLAMGSLVACGNNPTGKGGVEVYESIELTEETYAFAINKENDALTESVNEILSEMIADGSLESLVNSYFDGTATFTYENKTSSPAEGDFVVATNAYFPPFEYYEGNQLTGIDIEIGSIIANKLGKTLYVADMDFDAIIPAVMTNQADIGMAGMTVTDTRLESVDFAMGYYSSAQVLTVKKGDTTFADCKTVADVEAVIAQQTASFIIGTQNGTTGYMYSAGDADFGYDGFKNVQTKGYPTGALAMQDLVNGRINAVILDKQPSLMIAKNLNK